MSAAFYFVKKWILLLSAGGFCFPSLLSASDIPKFSRKSTSFVWEVSADRIELSPGHIRAEGDVLLWHPECHAEAGLVELATRQRKGWISENASAHLESLRISNGRIGMDWSGENGRRVRLFDELGDLPGDSRVSSETSRFDPRTDSRLSFLVP